MQFVLTIEQQDLLKLAVAGMRIANEQPNVLASQRGCYGGFYRAYHEVAKVVFGEHIDKFGGCRNSLEDIDLYDDDIGLQWFGVVGWHGHHLTVESLTVDGLVIPAEFVEFAKTHHNFDGSMLHCVAANGKLSTEFIRPHGESKESWYVSDFCQLKQEVYDLKDELAGVTDDFHVAERFESWLELRIQQLIAAFGLAV